MRSRAWVEERRELNDLMREAREIESGLPETNRFKPP